MKMYEKLGMSTEDALKWVGECATRNCRECPACAISKSMVSAKCAADYLLSEVPEPPKIPRWKTAKTQEDFDKFKDDFNRLCEDINDCEACKFTKEPNMFGCYHAFLSEMVAVPEDEEAETAVKKIREYETIKIGDEVESTISGKKGVVVACNLPNLDGEDKYAVCFVNEIVECSRQVLAKTDKHYNTFTEYLREVRNG